MEGLISTVPIPSSSYVFQHFLLNKFQSGHEEQEPSPLGVAVTLPWKTYKRVNRGVAKASPESQAQGISHVLKPACFCTHFRPIIGTDLLATLYHLVSQCSTLVPHGILVQPVPSVTEFTHLRPVN